jgi:hypothetical protein
MAKGIVPLTAFREVYGRADQATVRRALLNAFQKAISGQEDNASLAAG